MWSRRVAESLTVGCLAAALAVAPGCKKKVPPPPVVDPVPVPTVKSQLQVTTLTPGTYEANQTASAKVYGSGFEQGAKVMFGSAAATGVSRVDPNTLTLTTPSLAAGTYDVTVTNPDGTSATLRQGAVVRGGQVATTDCSATNIYFGFDSAGLSSDAKRVLSGKASCYTASSGQVRIAGHADERGTTDYNLALGQRRANAVKQYITTLGVGGSKVKTMSYGEERPADRGSNESAWAKNRRAEVTSE
jgi:peptidoglycan-associated lipoprotein